MKLALLSLIGMAAVNAQMHKFSAPSKSIDSNSFGAMEMTNWKESGMEKTVYLTNKPIRYDFERQTRILNQAKIQNQVNKERIASNKIYTCDNRSPDEDPDAPFMFFPVGVGQLNSQNNFVSYQNGMCFKNITFTYEQTGSADSDDIGDVTLTIDTEGADSLFCKDWFFFASAELYHVETFFFHGKHTITFKNISPDGMIDIKKNGIRVYMFCDGYVDTFLSVFHLALQFVGGLGTNPWLPIIGSHVPEYMEKANIAFLSEIMGYTMERRNITEPDVDFDSLIQSGDFLSIMRLDGLDPIIMFGTGSHAGHSVMALKFDGELYIIESQDGWYWPNHGIQKNKFVDWIQYARNADFHVSHLPLSPAARAKFNETAAHEFFSMTEGLPYGYHNFLFGWIDTPVDNYPPLMPAGLVTIVFSMIDKILPNVTDVFINQALNHRLGVKGLNMEQLFAEAARQNKSLDDVMAMVEIEGWEYEGIEPRDGRAYVCSSYVAAVYQAAGLLHNINGPEFTPKDVYTLNIFDLNFTRPQGCIDADPTSPYCQITGKYRMTHPGYSTIDPYSHMAENCPTLAPDYVRPAGC